MSQTRARNKRREKIKQSPEYQQLKRFYTDIEWRLDNLYHIKNKKGQIVKFVRNPDQRRLWKERWYLNIILKDRQRGFSTFIAILILDTCFWSSNQECGIIDITIDDGKKKLAKIKFAYDMLPESLKEANPLITDNKEQLEWANGSSVYVGTSHRGGTLQLLHVCLHGDTEIICKDSIVKKIKDINNSDYVLTSKGSYMKVESLVRNKLKDIGYKLLEIDTFGYYDPLKITSNHDVMTREFKTGKPVWKKAGDLKNGDYIAFPIREVTLKSRDGLLPFGKWEWLLDEKGKRICKKGFRIKPSFELGWLCGFYLAEGSVRRRNNNNPTDVVYSIHRKETALLLSYLSKIYKYLGTPKKNAKIINIKHVKDSLTTIVSVNSKNFGKFIEENFGCSDNKIIPDKVWGFGHRFVNGLIKGYFDGDGCYKSINEISATSTRRQLIDQMRRLLISMRYGYPTIYNIKAGFKYGRNCNEIWTIKLLGAGNWKFREKFDLELPEINTWKGKWRLDHNRRPEGRKNWRRGKKHYWSRITSIKDAAPTEYVYDLALKKDPHNYVTVNGVVHNSEHGKISARNPDKAREIRTGAFNTLTSGCYIFVESTAEGNSGEFYEDCQTAIKLKNERTPLTPLDFKFHFFGWWMGDENEMPAANVYISPEDEKYFTELQAELRQLYNDNSITITPEKKAWYVKKRDQQKGDMMREYPSTPAEAFAAAVQGAYLTKQLDFLYSQGMITDVPWEPSVPVSTAWDFGLRDLMCIWMYQRVGLQDRLINYMTGSDDDILYYWKELEKLNYIWGHHFVPHDANKRQIGTAKNAFSVPRTLEDIMHEAGMRNIVIVPKIDDKKVAIQESKIWLKKVWIDKNRCDKGVFAIKNFRREWDDKNGEFKNRPKHDKNMHGYDALETLARGLTEIGTNYLSNIHNHAGQRETSIHTGKRTPRTAPDWRVGA